MNKQQRQMDAQVDAARVARANDRTEDFRSGAAAGLAQKAGSNGGAVVVV